MLTPEGAPASEVPVTVGSTVKRPGASMHTSTTAMADANGRVVSRAMPGTIRLGVTAGAGGQAAAELGEVRSGERKQHVLRLRAAGSAGVAGQVVWEDGRPAADV